MIPVLGLEEGGAFPYLRAAASPLVCSEIASLAAALHKEAALWVLPSLAQIQMPRPTPRQLDSDMARLLGPILCGALLGFVCLGGEEAGGGGGGVGVVSWGQRPGLPAAGGERAQSRGGGGAGVLRAGWGEGVEGRAGGVKDTVTKTCGQVRPPRQGLTTTGLLFSFP